MSFSGDVKNELARLKTGARHCSLAELSALLVYSGTAAGPADGREDELVFRTESSEIAARYYLLLKNLFQIKPELQIEKKNRKHNLYVRVNGVENTRKILQAAQLADSEGKWKTQFVLKHSLLLQKDCCRRAYIRGAFLAAGSVSDPKRSYHLEIVCEYPEHAEQLAWLIGGFDIRAKVIQRKKYFVVYIKESEDISSFLGIIGSRVLLMDFENVRILKEMRGNVNRKVNCETANINKTVNASIRQIEDIHLIEERIGLEALPKDLDEAARVRLQYPEVTLKELGELMDPPISKSGVNHRLRKLSGIAEKLRNS